MKYLRKKVPSVVYDKGVHSKTFCAITTKISFWKTTSILPGEKRGFALCNNPGQGFHSEHSNCSLVTVSLLTPTWQRPNPERTQPSVASEPARVECCQRKNDYNLASLDQHNSRPQISSLRRTSEGVTTTCILAHEQHCPLSTQWASRRWPPRLSVGLLSLRRNLSP